MKYAIADGRRCEAMHGLQGTCPVCDALLTPKCGPIRVHHWAHPPGLVDHRWEPETEWHRSWKNRFPIECQELVQRATNGERHIADVRTAHGRVLEFQHSSILDQERQAREEFHRTMYWVVDGLRLQRDRPQFFGALRAGELVRVRPWTFIVPIGKCTLLQKWMSSRVHVFFDFGEVESESDKYRFGVPVLWAMVPGSPAGIAVLKPVHRELFMEALLKGEYPKGIVTNNVLYRAASMSPPTWSPPKTRPPQSFGRYMARKNRSRRNVRL